MPLLVMRAYWELIRADIFLARGNFASLYRWVRNQASDSRSRQSVEEISAAIDLACIWYWKRVLCLQRSAATARLLKAHGISAVLVIGGQQMPFKAHAWVEVDARVVNDKPYVREMYAVLDQC